MKFYLIMFALLSSSCEPENHKTNSDTINQKTGTDTISKIETNTKKPDEIVNFNFNSFKKDSIDKLYLESGLTFLKTSNYNEAIKKFSKIILERAKIDSLFINSASYRAYCYEKIGEYNLAINDYNLILHNYPNHSDALFQLSSLYGELGKYEESFKILDILLKITPDDFNVINNYSYYKNLSGDYREGIRLGELALLKTNDSIWVGVSLNNIGYSYLKLNKLEKAFELFSKSLEKFPKNSFAYRNRALYYIEKKDYDSACKDLKITKELGGFEISKELIKQYCK